MTHAKRVAPDEWKMLTENVKDPDGNEMTYVGLVNLGYLPWLRPYCVDIPDKEENMKQGKYRKKPVVIDAFQWIGTNHVKLFEWRSQWPQIIPDFWIQESGEVDILTLEDGGDGRAKHVASRGDYIIRGVQGEFYACKPDIFEMTYEPA